MDANRNFLEAALSAGLDCEIITPADVLKHLDPEVLAHHLPPDERTRLLAAALKAGRMDATLVLDVIEPRVFAEHMPLHVIWACIAEAAAKVLGEDLPAPMASGAVEPATPSGDSSSLLGEGSSRFRRPNASRRPARLMQSRGSSSDSSSRWNLAQAGERELPSSSPGTTGDPFATDWGDEAVSEAERPKQR